MTPQPLPDNLHPSQCYRLLDPERDQYQHGDKYMVIDGTNQISWENYEPNGIRTIPKGLVAIRPFTPPQPVQVQEFWRFLDNGEKIEADDEYLDLDSGKWEAAGSKYFVSHFNAAVCSNIRRRVTVPVAAPVAVADAPKAEPTTESGPYLVSVDGQCAPTCEHPTITEARTEAERLARQEHPAQVRLLRQVAVAQAEMTVKWEGQNI